MVEVCNRFCLYSHLNQKDQSWVISGSFAFYNVVEIYLKSQRVLQPLELELTTCFHFSPVFPLVVSACCGQWLWTEPAAGEAALPTAHEGRQQQRGALCRLLVVQPGLGYTGPKLPAGAVKPGSSAGAASGSRICLKTPVLRTEE